MKERRSRCLIVVGMVWLCWSNQGLAVTSQTEGAGSAVTVIDLATTFDTLTSTNIVHLETFSDGALSVITSGDSWAADLSSAATLDPFHGASDLAFYAIAWGNNDWVTIQTTNSTRMFAVEFMYGNTWTTGGTPPWGNHDAVLEWQTRDNGTLVSSGIVGTNQLLEMGTVVGFADPAGFDQLMVRSTTAGNGDLQAVALDNLQVQLAAIPEPSTIVLIGVGLGLLVLFPRRR